ncbi:MAG: hypothetical protein KatS3mg104_3061 [Phycisphaerae bacterium]|nr:MAG: hypothetical protein KatS3mg104_3061 [Phycisphaerae bacterium]
MITFERELKVDGVLTNADTTPTIRIVRVLSDGTEVEIVSETSTGVNNPSVGVYTYVFSATAHGATYRATWKLQVGGSEISTSSEKRYLSASDLVSLDDVKSSLGITGTSQDEMLRLLISAASEVINHYTDYRFSSSTHDEQYFNWASYDNQQVMLRNKPVQMIIRMATDPRSVVSIKHDSGMPVVVNLSSGSLTLRSYVNGVVQEVSSPLSAFNTVLDISNWINGIGSFRSSLLVNGDFPAGFLPTQLGVVSSIFAYVKFLPAAVENPEKGVVRYWTDRISRGLHAIYVAGEDEPPADVKLATILFVKYLMDKKDHSGVLESEKIGDYSYKLHDLGDRDEFLPEGVYTLLKPYLNVGW